MFKKEKTILQRFEEKFIPEPNSGCWLWLYHCNAANYGVFGIGRKSYLAHRVAYELYIGQIPNGKDVRHKCQNSYCVNPAHLYLGSRQDRVEDIKRFEEKFIPEPNSGCWLWLCSCNAKNGYGQFDYKDRKMGAHRVSYMLYVCEDIGDSHVLHKCDNKLCVNPEHLFLGSHKDNMQDKVKKNKQLKGEDCGPSKLTSQQVIAIYHDKRKAKVIAQEYKIHRWTVQRIQRNQSWSWLRKSARYVKTTIYRK